MRTVLLIILMSLSGIAVSAQTADSLRNIRIREVKVVALRPLGDIGIQRSRLDSVQLQQNVASSLGDVLLQNTNTFIKSYGRATLATISVRGTAPSHTQTTWNGMPLNSPMLGMTDFSLIPSYMVDDAALYYGASSVGVASGGLGGAVVLTTTPPVQKGLQLRYVQGVGSYCAFDEFAHIAWSNERWSVATRAMYASSPNDFHYTNYSKLPELRPSADGSVQKIYPTECNRSGDYGDFHLLQEVNYRSPSGHRAGLAVWYLNSSRGVPKLSTDYRDDSQTRARQTEQTLRAVASWSKIAGAARFSAAAGYAYTDMLYLYMYDLTGDGSNMQEGIHSQSYVNTLFARAEAQYTVAERLLVSGFVTLNQHFVDSRDKSIVDIAGQNAVVGYRQARSEVSAFGSVRYTLARRVGIAASVRWDVYGSHVTPVVPAAFVDYTPLSNRRGEIVVKASITRNYRYPTLNDLYFQPGGNPDLRPESGFTYDVGVKARFKNEERLQLSGEVSAFDSRIDDWILWRPTFKGFWTPLNVKRVHSYGVEAKATADVSLGEAWHIAANGVFTLTHSVNRGDRVSDDDTSVGRQLPYIPVRTAAATLRVGWRRWTLSYKWRHYSRRYTTSSNELSLTGSVAPYFMSDLSLERRFAWRWADVVMRVDVNNMAGEEYETVLAHPMPRRNYAFNIDIRPNFKHKK